MKAAIFFERDGVLNLCETRHGHQVTQPAILHQLPICHAHGYADELFHFVQPLVERCCQPCGQPARDYGRANELLHGAPVIKELLTTELRELVQRKSGVIQGWVDAGQMAAVDGTHLFFTIWAATQTYADFDVQVSAVLGRSKLSNKDHAEATEHVVSLILRGCGL